MYPQRVGRVSCGLGRCPFGVPPDFVQVHLLERCVCRDLGLLMPPTWGRPGAVLQGVLAAGPYVLFSVGRTGLWPCPNSTLGQGFEFRKLRNTYVLNLENVFI